jgi:hypothetical protein
VIDVVSVVTSGKVNVVTEVNVWVSVMHPEREGAAVTDVLEYRDGVERALHIFSAQYHWSCFVRPTLQKLLE